MAAIFLAVEFETAIAQREFPVCLAGSDRVGQHATHLVLAIVGDNFFAEIHHTATFGLNPSALFGIRLDGFPACLVRHKSLEMLLRIAARQIQ